MNEQIEKIMSMVSCKKESQENEELSTQKQKELYKTIELVKTLLPFLPENKHLKAELIIKFLECAILFDKLKTQADN